MQNFCFCGPAFPMAPEPPGLFVLIWFPDYCWFALFVLLVFILIFVFLIVVIVGYSRGHSVKEQPGAPDVRIRGFACRRGGSLEQPPPFPLQVTLSFQGILKRVRHGQSPPMSYLERLPHPFRSDRWCSAYLGASYWHQYLRGVAAPDNSDRETT